MTTPFGHMWAEDAQPALIPRKVRAVVGRFEYIDHASCSHVFSADGFYDACATAWRQEYDRTGSFTLADRAASTVEASDERSRA